VFWVLSAGVSSLRRLQKVFLLYRDLLMVRWVIGFNLFQLFVVQVCGADDSLNSPWTRHVIDSHSQGADGTRLADVNRDGLLDIVTGWEQGGISRICLHPGYQAVRKSWPGVTVGSAKDVEDALLIDLDADGAMDVVSCCEGGQQSIRVHWGDGGDVLREESWETVDLPDSVGVCRWMYSTPLDVNQDGQIDLVAGGKGAGAMLGWWELPSNPRDVAAWQWHPLRKMGWLMSLEVIDMNADGKMDLLFSDRKGERSGVFWLENPGADSLDLMRVWPEHEVGGLHQEVMFLSIGDLDSDTVQEIVVAIRPQKILVIKRDGSQSNQWRSRELAIPETFGTAKATAIADFDLDDQAEIVFSTENAKAPKMGIGMFDRSSSDDRSWELKSISGVDGVKHDLLVPIDLDGDGDVDVLTCEEVKNLGVIWYENPIIRFVQSR
jgi:hypothetical protein